jgi:hypothetical protein
LNPPTPPQDCLAAEAAQPLLQELAPYIDPPTRRLYAAASAVDQFQRLLQGFGGPRETARWRDTLRPRIEVYCPSAGAGDGGGASGQPPQPGSSSEGGGGSGGGGAAAAASAEAAPRAFALPPALAALRMARHSRDTFGLGISLRALTLTAHGSAVRHLAEQSVAVEAFVHRPVWLTGL